MYLPTVVGEGTRTLYYELLDCMDRNGVVSFESALEINVRYADDGKEGMDLLMERMAELEEVEWVFPDPPNWIVCLPPRI